MIDFKGHEMNYFGFKGIKRGKWVMVWGNGLEVGLVYEMEIWI